MAASPTDKSTTEGNDDSSFTSSPFGTNNSKEAVPCTATARSSSMVIRLPTPIKTVRLDAMLMFQCFYKVLYRILVLILRIRKQLQYRHSLHVLVMKCYTGS
mmetsp:Transcript_4118/g.5599  ORF Transcript_4118/g.5599 Transcript_4118/m.5599 type:complete len:102 (+) Transcript_4118:2831-3136(+)